MKRGLTTLFLLLFPAGLFAAEPTTHSYLIATRHHAREAIARISRGEDPDHTAGRNVRPFDIVDAYAADLTDDEAQALRQSPEVRYVEQDVTRYALRLPVHTAPTELRSLTGQTTPYGVRIINAVSMWPVTRGAGVNVAILDTGIDITHPDLQAAYAGGFNTYFGDPKYPAESQQPIDDNDHGTHVSGTVAATDNDFGVVGVAPNVRLWMVRVMHDDGQGGASGTTTKIVAGIQWVVQQKQTLGGNWIISMSLGSCGSSTTESNAINSAINAGILVVAAAGNHDPTTATTECTGASSDNYAGVDYPAAYPGVVAVAAVDSTSTVASFSNTGPEVSIAGPGVAVLSTVRVGHGAIGSVTPSGGSVIAGVPLEGSPFGTLTGNYVNCGFGNSATEFPSLVSGKIAVIERGGVVPNGGSPTFALKVKNAQAAGATAVVLYNKDGSDISAGFTLTADPADAGHVWPIVLMISNSDGQTLLSQSPRALTVASQPDNYATLDGTSMATPHVAAAAALVWSIAPGATADAVKQALFSTATDLGAPGPDSQYGNGLVNPLAAARVFGVVGGSKPLTPPFTGRPPGRRGH